MTKAEAVAALLQGATNTNAQMITVTREHLVLALSPDPSAAPEEPDGSHSTTARPEV